MQRRRAYVRGVRVRDRLGSWDSDALLVEVVAMSTTADWLHRIRGGSRRQVSVVQARFSRGSRMARLRNDPYFLHTHPGMLSADQCLSV